MNTHSNRASSFVFISLNHPIYTRKGVSADVQLNLNLIVETKKEAEASFAVFYLSLNARKEAFASFSSLIQMPTTGFELAKNTLSQRNNNCNAFKIKKIEGAVSSVFSLMRGSCYSNLQGILNLNLMETKNVWNTVTF